MGWRGVRPVCVHSVMICSAVQCGGTTVVSAQPLLVALVACTQTSPSALSRTVEVDRHLVFG